MTTITEEQAEIEAARNWCAGMLSAAGSRIEGEVAERYVDIGVGILLSIYKDEEMSDEEKTRRCGEAYVKGVAAPDAPYPPICIVDGEEYTYCHDCPLRRE